MMAPYFMNFFYFSTKYVWVNSFKIHSFSEFLAKYNFNLFVFMRQIFAGDDLGHGGVGERQSEKENRDKGRYNNK